MRGCVDMGRSGFVDPGASERADFDADGDKTPLISLTLRNALRWYTFQ